MRSGRFSAVRLSSIRTQTRRDSGVFSFFCTSFFLSEHPEFLIRRITCDLTLRVREPQSVGSRGEVVSLAVLQLNLRPLLDRAQRLGRVLDDSVAAVHDVLEDVARVPDRDACD